MMSRSLETPRRKIITFGTFDVFHVGHVNILTRARDLGEYLVVGVSSDALNMSKKGRYPVYNQAQRLRIVASLSCVDEVTVLKTRKIWQIELNLPQPVGSFWIYEVNLEVAGPSCY